MIVYGISTCDTVRKARRALEEAGREVTFRDVRAEPLSAAEVSEFEAAFGEKIVNRASTTWRKLTDETRAMPVAELLQEHPALMKRPVIREGAQLTLGWGKDVQAQWL
ncbi:arsenate reductase [Thioclava dalianensis]|uniref:Arsenate reductase n=1 Tax=Thioclava dalianensis TaxID=1185766 RepID=A0A074TL00_9RHOB|nr:ArsC/Spx/MgsR family protein [Thioclava dalianensis]KEP70840.1 arsenate reductase [Thioclava dalianensis]SFN12191.1 transcriptional regulator, Spx/MgsR family [Thioclava dalianensis]